MEIKQAKFLTTVAQSTKLIQNLNNDLFKLEKENYDPTLVSNWPLTEEGRLYFEELIENHFVIVATLNKEIVAYLAGSINEKGSYEEIQYGEINNMLVTDKCRGLGIGKLLINEFKIPSHGYLIGGKRK